MKLTQSTALEQTRFDLRSLSPALRNLWLLLVIIVVVVVSSLILIHEKFLQFDWLRAVVFQLNLKYLHVRITDW